MAARQRRLARPPITAENIAIIQAQIEKELSLKTKTKVLNGRVKSSCSASDCSTSVEEIGYEFQYGGSDTGRSDQYVYRFETFPADQGTNKNSSYNDVAVVVTSGYEKLGEFPDSNSRTCKRDENTCKLDADICKETIGVNDTSSVEETSEKQTGPSCCVEDKERTRHTSESGTIRRGILKKTSRSESQFDSSGFLKKYFDSQKRSNNNKDANSEKHISSSTLVVTPSRPSSKTEINSYDSKSRKISSFSKCSEGKNDSQEDTSTKAGETKEPTRRVSCMTNASRVDSEGHGERSRHASASSRRKSVCYDPTVEKATAALHGGGKNFSCANTTLMPVKYGIRYLQTNYTETNLETNQSLLFFDLLKTSHAKSQIRNSHIRSIERRLEWKRKNPFYSTSYYENKKIPDPFRRNTKKTARTAAQKKIERKEKIKQISDELQTGYVPTQLTMKIADRKEVVNIGSNCRYLRSRIPSDDQGSEEPKKPDS